jgi:NADPH-dependent curcumin reductase CurA
MTGSPGSGRDGSIRVTDMPTNRQIRLAARPHGELKPTDWDHHDAETTEPGDGEFAGRTRFVSLDPAMRGWLDDRPSYVPPVGLGDVMRAGSIVEIIESRHPDFAVGDHVVGMFGVQEHVVSDGGGAQKVDPDAASLPTYLGALGMPGLTAYFGLLDVGALEEGNTVVVSGAAGAVGSVVGQIAKARGAGRVVGIAGGPEKCEVVTGEFGFDACIDYREGDVRRALRRECPDGIDVYFDNVGGEILDAALANIALGARVVICGAISQYNATEPRKLENYLALLVRRARMEGFIVFDFARRYGEAASRLAEWVRSGQLHTREQVVQGTIDYFPDTLSMLFRGENVGKLVLELTSGS